MILSKGRMAITAGIVLFLGFFLAVPIVPYSASVSIPRNYGESALTICQPLISNATSYDACLQKNALPPATVDGRSALAYSILGFGAGPFPPVTLITQGHESALVYWRGSFPAMAELLSVENGRVLLGSGEASTYGGPPTLLSPGTLTLSDVGFTPDSNGYLQFSATVSEVPSTNYSGDALGSSFIPAPEVYFDYPGHGFNSTGGGVVWHTPVADIGCGGPARYCVASRLVAANPNLQEGGVYPLTLAVYGYQAVGEENITETFTNGQQLTYTFPKLREYVHVQTLGVRYPGSGVNAAWAQAFMTTVNQARVTSLVEDPGLDAFAQTRFTTASGTYQISDFGFDNQSAAYFIGTGRVSTEEILFPTTYSPSEFATYLQQQAPVHWAGLLDGAYTKFGYFIGTAPYVEFGTSCPVTVITQRNINITQLAIQNGCVHKTVTTTWLLIVLSS